MTLGYSPAMLEHILDEALVWAIREGRKELNWRDVQRARLSEEIGLAQPIAYTDNERDLIATHEAGHAVAAYLCAKGPQARGPFDHQAAAGSGAPRSLRSRRAIHEDPLRARGNA